MTSQVSHPYKSTDFTQALNILILVSFLNDLDSHTLLDLENDPLAFCNRSTYNYVLCSPSFTNRTGKKYVFAILQWDFFFNNGKM